MSSVDNVYDLVGLGFGPANIAISAALTEKWQADPNFSVKKTLFIEKHEVFRWHPGMLLPGANMQISFLKDLATLRSPNSPYTFLNYLHTEGRLLSFINRGSTVPTRKEYADYLAWAAAKVQQNGVPVKFGHEIYALDDGPNGTIQVRYRNLKTQEEHVVYARDLIIAPGGMPRIPDFLQTWVNDRRVVHSSSYALKIGGILDSLSAVSASRPLRVAIIGSGQSAAEVTMDVRNRLSAIPTKGGRHTVEMLIRKGSLKPSDDSPFANEIFDPASTDAWFNTGSKHLRDAILAEYKQTNYSVVNPKTLEPLYEIVYGQRLNAGIASRCGEAEPSDPIIDIKTYTSINSLSKSTSEMLLSPEAADTEPLVITTTCMMTGAVTKTKYDAVLGIAKHFGLSPSTSQVTLRPSCDRDQPAPINYIAPAASASTSHASTPQTSPETSAFNSPRERPTNHEIFVSRTYRLLRQSNDSPLAARVYLQGVAEQTHGLSDTLLSILGVRSGIVVDDLASRVA